MPRSVKFLARVQPFFAPRHRAFLSGRFYEYKKGYLISIEIALIKLQAIFFCKGKMSRVHGRRVYRIAWENALELEASQQATISNQHI